MMKKLNHYFYLAAALCILSVALTGCGNKDNASTSGNNKNNAVNDAADDVGSAVGDAADDIGNAVDDLVGKGGFDNYNDAHDYFLDTMGSYHADAKFEVRDEDRELNDYQEGSKGYRFNLYDTSKKKEGEMFGEFYVDATSGAIYRRGDDDSIEAYPGTPTGTDSQVSGIGAGANTSVAKNRGNGSEKNTDNRNISSNTTGTGRR
ncbi:MAG: hypothetical protein NC300_10465 [Bacteroidales bacterium]|nr:ubiquinone biosynthesis protein [Clostridium sp.]MCM1204554.1 hypothetical protein [Bacteroidales bacterium]